MGENKRKRSKKRDGRVKSLFMGLDLFGESIGFNIDGSERSSSCVGSLISLVIYILVFVYGIQKFITLLEYGDTNH